MVKASIAALTSGLAYQSLPPAGGRLGAGDALELSPLRLNAGVWLASASKAGIPSRAPMPSERFGRRERARLEALRSLAPPPRELSWTEVARVDRERLWWAMRALDRGDLMQLLVRALAEVPPGRLEVVFRDRARPGDVGAGADEQDGGVRADVEKFCDLARTGHFYEAIPYRGSEQSHGTQEFVARCHVMFDRCVAAEGERADPRQLRSAFEMLFDLMRRVDDGQEIVHFTDEAGAWQIGVVWERVHPAYFKCLARTATEGEVGPAVDRAIADYVEHGSHKRPDLRRAAEDAWSSKDKV